MHTKCAFSELLEEPALKGIFSPSKMTLFLPIFNYKYCKSEIAFRKKSSLSTRKILAALSIKYSGGICLFFLYKKKRSLNRFSSPRSFDSSENIKSLNSYQRNSDCFRKRSRFLQKRRPVSSSSNFPNRYSLSIFLCSLGINMRASSADTPE